jgi:hypothetical protein
MVFWVEIDKNVIDMIPSGKERTKFRYENGPLRFQIPRGMCTWGVSAYKSLQVDLSNEEFAEWWRDLETQLCPREPFNTNLKGAALRLKIDDVTYIFDQNSKQVTLDIREGLFRGQEMSCIIDVDSTYFFNGSWGLTCRVYQLKLYDPIPAPETASVPPVPSDDAAPAFQKGTCAFLPV